jgi:hypothetical protein
MDHIPWSGFRFSTPNFSSCAGEFGEVDLHSTNATDTSRFSIDGSGRSRVAATMVSLAWQPVDCCRVGTQATAQVRQEDLGHLATNTNATYESGSL